MMQAIHILLVEDNPADAELTEISLHRAKILSNAKSTFHAVHDGMQAMDFLRRHPPYADAPRPDLILLDLNMPGMDGRAVLREIKSDETLCSIPVAILSSSMARADVAETYRLHANFYLRKPTSYTEFQDMLSAIKEFWFETVLLPPRE